MYDPGHSRSGLGQRAFPSPNRPTGRSLNMRMLIGLAMAAFAVISYFGSRTYNPVTGENQYVKITEQQEIAMGLQAAPEMARQHGGLHPDAKAQALVDRVGQKLVQSGAARQTNYRYDFHLLADTETVNAFALPGGQVFITAALAQRLQTEGQLAGVLGHEIGHVVARHGAERIAQQELTQGLTGALVLATYDPNNPSSQRTAQVGMMIAQLVNLKYGRDDELESDKLGVRFMADAGYDPRALTGVMKILEAASGGSRQPEFFSTHPNPDNRIGRIQEAVKERFPNGVPQGLTP
jgi:beta-barrel assembly-enhancing protease